MSIPMLMRIQVVEKGRKKISLYFPLILAWIIILPFLILFLPIFILAVLLTWHRGHGRFLLRSIPLLFSVLGSLSGLVVQVENGEDRTFINFK